MEVKEDGDTGDFSSELRCVALASAKTSNSERHRCPVRMRDFK